MQTRRFTIGLFVWLNMDNEEKLQFPIFKEALPKPRNLPMEEYFSFIDMCREYFYKREVSDYWREKRRVNVPFRLK